jgi:hypothetical protein
MVAKKWFGGSVRMVMNGQHKSNHAQHREMGVNNAGIGSDPLFFAS